MRHLQVLAKHQYAGLHWNEMHKKKIGLGTFVVVGLPRLSLSLHLFSYYSNFISLCLFLTLFLGLVSLRLHSLSTASAAAASCVYEGSLLLVAGTLLLLTAQQHLPWQLTCCSIWHFLYLFLASLSLSLLAFSTTFSAIRCVRAQQRLGRVQLHKEIW